MKKIIVILCGDGFLYDGLMAQLTVKGKVLDENGVPLAGAVVVELSSNNGTITDVNGDFVGKCTRCTDTITI